MQESMRKFIAFLLLAAFIFLSPGCKTSVSADLPVAVQADVPVGERESGGDAAVSEVTELVVLHTNDFHGHPVSFFNYPAPNVGGLPAISTLVRQIRETHENVLLLDAGDLNTGRPESNLFKAEADLIGYNYIGYDAMVLGNHEFDNSPAVLKRQMDLAMFPFLSANVTWKDGSYVAEAPYIIKDFKGLKVGIFGLTIKETEFIGNPDYIGQMLFHDEIQTARRMVAELKDKTHLIIALTHLGLYGSNDRGSRQLAAKVAGIDLIVDGHTHTRLNEPVVVNGTPIVQAWHWGLVVGQGTFTIIEGKKSGFRWESIPINLKRREKKDGKNVFRFVGEQIEEDTRLVSLMQPYVEQVDTLLAKVVGIAEAPFFYGKVRRSETAIGNLVADAMLWYSRHLSPDFAIQNGGGIRADIPDGEIAKKVLYEVLPFDNSVMVVELRGTDVAALFDYIATIPNGKGAFAQVSEGVSFTLDYETGKCENVMINGGPIDPNRTYRIVTNSYMAAGGDGYSVFKRAVSKYDTWAFQRDVVIEYIMHLGGRIVPRVGGRIKIKRARGTTLGTAFSGDAASIVPEGSVARQWD